MKIIISLVYSTFLCLVISGCYEPTGCYGPMTGTVVDAETEKPIESAVVYVQWTIKTGLPGLISTNIYDVVEKITDKEGTFRVWGVLNPMVNKPLVVVYKKGYVAWRSDYIFPEYEHRKGFKWKRTHILKLEQVNDYSHYNHIFFISSGLALSSTKLENAYSWEWSLAEKELELLRKKRKSKKGIKYSEKEIWKEIVEELYLQQKGGNRSE